MKYICTECAREIPWDEYQHQSDIFCSECGGHIEEITEDLASQTAVNQLSETKEAAPTATTTIKSYLISCESCSHQFSKRAESCPKCGWKPQVMCQICQQKIPFDSTVCPGCGDPNPFELPEKTKQGTFSTDYKQTTSVTAPSVSSSKQKNVVTDRNSSPQFSLGWFLFSFDGRIARQAFWCAYPIIFFLGLIISVALELVKESRNMNGLFIIVIFMLLLLWPSLAVQVKRYHDRNKSGNWILLNFIPIIGSLWVTIELGFLKGTEGNNDYGTDPLLN